MKIKVKALFEAAKWFSDATEPWTPSSENLVLEYWVEISESKLKKFFNLSTMDLYGDYLWDMVEDHDIYTNKVKLSKAEILRKINFFPGKDFYFHLFYVCLVKELLVLKEKYKVSHSFDVQ